MKKFYRLLASCLAFFLLTGCAGLSYGELYSLPRASEDYYDLQMALSGVQDEGYSYQAPASGPHQEPVQLVDLDGDGVDEALAFFRSADGGEVKIYIFSREKERYTQTVVLDGAGSGVSSVEYADVDGRGGLELIVAYQVSESVTQALQVYRYENGEAASLLSTSCSRYVLCDLDGDQLPGLVTLTTGGADGPAVVECYDTKTGDFHRIGEQRLRFSYENLRRVQHGAIGGGSEGVIFSGVGADGQQIIDVCAVTEDGFIRIEPEEDILISSTVHSYFVYPEDLDGDGVLEFPQTRQLPAYDDGSAAQWAIEWYSLSLDGQVEHVTSTFENFSEGWYLQLLEAWDRDLIIKASDESTTVSTVTIFRSAEKAGDPAQEILTIYTLRGARRQEYVDENSLTILYSASDSETIYALSLAAAEPWEGTATKAQVSEMFHVRDNS